MGQPSPRKTDLVWKSGMKVFEGKESKGRSGREESSALQWAFRGTSSLCEAICKIVLIRRRGQRG